MGAGILPIALYKGAIYLLLGQERNNLWSDFGGTSHKNEKPFNTAIREGYEELNGFLGNIDDLEEHVKSNLVLSISFEKYTTYLFNIEYHEYLPLYFNNLNAFIEINAHDKIMKDHNGLFEKKEITWLELKKYKNNNNIIRLRDWYKPIIDNVAKNEKLLIKEIKHLEKSKNKLLTTIY